MIKRVNDLCNNNIVISNQVFSQQVLNSVSTIHNQSIIQHNISVLEVKIATYDSHGLYECVIGNIFGNAIKSFRVFVRG